MMVLSLSRGIWPGVRTGAALRGAEDETEESQPDSGYHRPNLLKYPFTVPPVLFEIDGNLADCH
jgi:hypothetical protein